MVVSAFRFALGIVAAFSLFVFVADSQGVFPCHSGREQLGAPGCTDITLPYDLCKNCPIKDVAPNGDFKNCRSIYDIDAPKCMGQLIQYVQMNTCDWRRAEQMDQWLNSGDNWVKAQAKEKLDYFVYAVCEECCDCIPISSSYKDYSVAAQNEDDLFTHTRGNCAAHAYYDICRLLPDIKSFNNPGNPVDSSDWPNICSPLQNWFNVNGNWLTDHNSDASWEIQRFLKNVNRKTQCGSETMWTNCRSMEQAQKRI